MECASRRIAVVGGGVSGLAAAYALARARQAGAPVEDFLVEASDHLGGLIRTERTGGFVVEAGPDSFLAEKPEATALARELGLAESLLGSNDALRRTYILHRGRLVPLPDGFMLMVPRQLWPVFSTPLLPWGSKLKTATEWLRAAGRQPEDESVASFVRRHFGDGMARNVAAPLVAGVFGGDSERLSARSALPRFWAMEQKHGSLTRAVLRARREHAGNAGAGGETSAPLFVTLREGLGRLVEALSARLDSSRLCLRRRLTNIERRGEAGVAPYTLRREGGTEHEADAVILALPAHEGARLVAPLDSKLASALAAIPYTSALTVSLAYGPGVPESLPAGFGFLVPRREGRRLLACTFVHVKFDARAPEGCAILRCFLGGAHDPSALELSDDEAASVVREEVRAIVRLRAEPLWHRIYRWPAAMPQYEVGHAARVEEIERRLEQHPGLFLAGNAYSGVGISDCIRTGQAAAARALQLAGWAKSA